MRGRGRKPDLDGLIERREGSEEAKRKVKTLLRTFGEELTVIDAGRELGLGEGRAHVWRERMLQGAVLAMEPKPVGRPRRSEGPEEGEVERLERELSELRRELLLERVREELSILRPGGAFEKKTR